MFASRAVQQHTQDQTPSRAKQASQAQTPGLRQSENVPESSPPLHRYLGNSYVQAMSATDGSGGLTAPSVPLRPSQSGILQRKCACGNPATGGECSECSKKQRLGLQTKLKINEPGDIYELEADRIADQVMATPAHPAVSGAPPRIQRFAGQPAGQANAAPASVDQALTSPGRPLEPALRQDMEQRFGYDFSRVRMHFGPAAEQSAQDVNATAYTVGDSIVFGAGRFTPGTHEGRRLLAHELTHVVQQSGSNGIRVDPSHEKWGLSPIQIPLSEFRLQRQTPPTIGASDDFSSVVARLDAIIRTGGPLPTDQTRVIGAAIVDVEGYTGPREIRAISGAATDALGQGAPVHHALTPTARTLSATRTIGGSGQRREFPFSHINDAEIKMFEEIAEHLPPNAKGTIHFSTMRNRVTRGRAALEPAPACSGCNRATFEMGAFRQINMVSHAATYPTGSLDISGGSAPMTPQARTVSGEVTVPQRGSVTPSGGGPSGAVTTASGEVTVPQRGSVTPSGGGPSRAVTTASGEIAVPPGFRKSLSQGFREGLVPSPAGIAAEIPGVVLHLADRAAAVEAIRRIQVKFTKEGFAKGVAAGVMRWSEEEVRLNLKNRINSDRVQGLEDPAGFLTASYILQLAEAYENQAVDLGYQFSSSRTVKWNNDMQTKGLAALAKYRYDFGGDPQVLFEYDFIEKLAKTLHPITNPIIEKAIEKGDERRRAERKAERGWVGMKF
jgi:hypothetical protein